MILIKNGTIYPITKKPFKGDILIENGIIKKIGENIEEKNAEVIDASGKYVFPGFIDAHSHIGVFEEGVGEFYYQDGNEFSNPLTPEVRALDAFYPGDAAIKRALSGGVTTAMIVPGSANPIGGQGFIVKFKSDIVDEMVVKQPAGLKMAFGENPKRVYGSQKKAPMTRLGVAATIREYFTRVKDYMKRRQEDPKTPVDFKLEIGEKVLKKEIPARCHAHRADDIVTAIRIAEEFNFDIIIEHATEGYKIAHFLKKKRIPVVLGPLFGFRTKLELVDMTYESIRIINEHGILAALMCDHPVIHLEHANIHAATALRYGAKEEDLLKMLTINPAKILKIDNKTGSIEEGKDADIVIWNTHPFDFRARAEKVFIEGKLVYEY